MSEPLSQLVKNAWEVGRKIDLSDVGYGRIHWGNQKDVRDEPSSYYFFLAGLVRQQGFNRILEIGTHWGGATRAMYRGMANPDAGKIVTIDITTESDNRLKGMPKIVKMVGDGNSEEVLERILTEFGNDPVDMVFIDAAHQMMPTLISYGLYSTTLRPKLMVFDDISFNEGMKRAWSIIKQSAPPSNAINATEVDPAIRPATSGLGVLRCR